MSSKLVNHLRLTLLSFLGIASTSLDAMPAGNPAFPVIPGINIEQKSACTFDLCNSYDVLSALSGNLKLCFCGDYIFSEEAQVKDVPVVTSVTTSGIGPIPTITSTTKNRDFDLVDCSLSSNCVAAAFSIPDRTFSAIPLFDMSCEVKIGGLKQYYRLPMNAYRDFTSDKLNSESEVTDGLIEVQSNYGFVWDVSLKKVLWKDGVSFVGVGADYRHASCPIDYIIANSQANPEVFIADSEGKLSLKEWSVCVGLTTYVNDYVLPYIAFSVGNVSREAPDNSFKKLEDRFTNLKFKVRKITSSHRGNICIGATNYIADNFFYNVEGRWGSQRAINISGGFQF